MDSIVWSNKYSVKLDDIDEKKQELVRSVNGFLDVLERGMLEKELFESLADFLDSLRKLFKCEENYLIRLKYPDAENHVNDHKAILNKVLEYRRWIAEDPEDLTEGDFGGLLEIIESHIHETDQEYASYIRLRMFMDNARRR